MTVERFEVVRDIPADAAAIFKVLCDPLGHVAIDSSGMLMDATGEPAGAVGDSFVVHMDREALNDFPLGHYDVTVTITTFVQDREIAWGIVGARHRSVTSTATRRADRHRHSPTSYYDWSTTIPCEAARHLPIIPENCCATLGILERTVLRGGARPPVGKPKQAVDSRQVFD